ncbi:hypothetical protein V1477_013798 [Vespula maculifrons]|uniref:Odorant receptor n=1 Tax=Vespula maculifrons TaxID=7453 RepID=A0ABD2BPA5_VESMC
MHRWADRCLNITTDSSTLLTEEDYIDNEYYAYNRLFFRLLGLWQHQTSCKQFIYVCFINLLFFIETFEQIYALLTLEKKLISITKLLETILPTLCFGACYFNLLWNATNMKKIFYRIKCDWNDLSNKPELIILKKYANVSRHYKIIIAGIANYSMFIAVIQHACALFYIVEWRVNERFRKPPQNFYYANTDDELAEEKECIISIIEYYNNAIEFILSLTFNLTEAIGKLLYVISSLFAIYVYSFLAQKLIDHNANVFLKFCQIPFYLLSLRTQKLLLCLLMSSMRVCSISLKGAIVVSHDLFATFMRKAFSFAMVLYSLQ